MKQLYPTNFTFTFRLLPLNRNTSLFLLVFLLNFTLGFGQQPENTVPDYDWLDFYNLGNADAESPENLVISIDTDSQGFVYILTFGNGVFKFDPVNKSLERIITDSPGESGNLNGPLDIVIDNYDIIYIADSGSKLIKKFDVSGNPVDTIGSGFGGNGRDEFWEPTGLAIDDENNLYIVDSYRGDNNAVVDRFFLKVYYSTGEFKSFQGTISHPLFQPYRVAASGDYILISHAANDGEVLVFNSDLTYRKTLSNIGSPGSIVIDNYNFIHVVDYADELDFNLILDYPNLEFLDYLTLYSGISRGINENKFAIQIYDDQLEHQTTLTDEIGEEKIQLPLDLAFNDCSRLYLNDGSLNGLSIDFNLEVFNRTPSFDTEDPLAVCESGLEFTLENGEVTITAEQIDGGSTDNCQIADLELSRYTFDQASDYEIELTVTDAAGNTDTCETTITILPGEEELFIDCPANQTADFQGNCEFELPDYTDDANFTSGATVIQFPEEGTFITENTEITLTANLNGETEECTFNVEATNRRPDLAISCSGDQTETADANDVFDIPDYTDLANVENSCGAFDVTQSPIEGTEIENNTTVTLSVVDDRGVSVDCSFEVILNFQEELFIDCPADQTADFQGNCEFELPDYTDDANFTSGATVTQFPEEGTFITENTEITLTAELDGEIRDCTFMVEATNQRPALAISCPGDQTEDANANDTFEIPDYTNLANVANSCGNINVTQSPVLGTMVDENTTITLSAVDDRGVSVECEFEVILNFTEPSAPEIGCLPQELFLDENGQATIDPEDIFAGDRGNLVLTTDIQNFDCSNLGENTVILTALDPDTGLSSSCPTEVFILDDIFPEANCVAPGREFRLQNGSVTISPSAIDLNSEDNCEITRTLSEDTFTTPGTKNIILYVEDSAGNTDQCSTSIEILAEDDQSPQPNYECFEGNIPDLRLDEDCEVAVIPDYSYLVETENFTPRFEQTEERFGETLVVTLDVINAENNNLVGECTFSINIVDLLPPNISCPGDQTENFDSETGFEVPNYESWATFSDNCGEVSFRQEPEAGAIIFQDTTVQLFAEDANEQVANCSFELQLTEANVLNIFCQIDQNVSPDEDCSFTLPDYTDTAEVSLPGATVTQSPPEGTVINGNTQVKLTATLNGETDECFFMVNLVDNEDPVANCVSGYVVNLDESGNATLAPEMLDNNSTDNCGIVSMALSQINFTRADIGEVPITLTVRDDAGNMDTCETTVEVVDENSGEFECRENVLVNLNENGEAVLSLQELYMGNASGLTLEASRLNFICSDLGMVQIQLDYSGVQTGSCTINVEVRDEIPPLINTDIVELTLDDEGFAYLEEGDVLAENNCGAQFIYRFSKSVFNCEDVGVNTVNVEVEDANGNIAEKNIEVRVNGEACEIPDNEDLEFLFIYPNPNNGTFTIATPEGMQVEQVRVFDSRGRFILQKEYKDIARFYRMTIEGVESSVYTLQIFTNEGVVVKRVIISQ